MKTLVMLIALFVTTQALALHPDLKQGEVYKIPSQYLCRSSDILERAVNLQLEKNLAEAQMFVRIMQKLGHCVLFPGGGVKFDEVVNRWDVEGNDYWAIRWLDGKGQAMYGLLGLRRHEERI